MAAYEIDDEEFQAWAKRVDEKIATDAVKLGIERSARRIKAQSMREVKARTIVDTGHLRRTWHVSGPFIGGTVISLELYNNTEYAPFVENGHRTRGGSGWVEGRFMLRDTIEVLEAQLPSLISPSLRTTLKGLLD
ncbi:HK97 gp10 family phage protein [Levilactobacillus hammesii]|uniref:HK97 gp10 family phage protein n=1 Tax=Levilactobacillus hammesii TaxID=267633 RepID=UPI00070E43FC|nr:HK97 gp10 family phage protein [Levilactobacillus hammesii]